jgi:hypothetical protein
MDKINGASRYLRYMSIGLEIAVSLAAPIALGVWLDGRYGTSPYLVLAGCVVGVLLFIRIGIRLAAMERNEASGKGSHG